MKNVCMNYRNLFSKYFQCTALCVLSGRARKVNSFGPGGYIILAIMFILRCMRAKIFILATGVTRSFVIFPQSFHVNVSILSLNRPRQPFIKGIHRTSFS
jgi:hypothetical protein